MSEEFAKELLMYSSARAGCALGYKTTNAVVLETLSDVMGHYMKSVSVKMKENGEIAGRSVPGIPDLLHSLDSHNSNWRSLRDFAFEKEDNNIDINEKRKTNIQKWDQPFFLDVPSFPVRRRQKDKSLIDKKSKITSIDIPSHLPSYPPRHTWSMTNKNKRTNDDKTIDENEKKKNKITVNDSVKKSISLIEDSIDASILKNS